MVIYPGLIARDFIITKDGEQHAFGIYLWESIKDKENYIEIVERCEPKSNARASMMAHEYKIDKQTQFLGEIHFVKNNWNIGIIAHELQHMLFHYIKGCVYEFTRWLYLDITPDEEAVCYEMEYWAQYVFNWLFKNNPRTEWSLSNAR